MEVVDVVLDEYAGLEEFAKQEAIFKRQEEDQKKEEKLLKDVEKAIAKEAEKKVKAVARVVAKEIQKKEKKGIHTAPALEVHVSLVDNTSVVQGPPTMGRILASPYTSLIAKGLTRGPLPKVEEDVVIVAIKELIINTTVKAILSGMNGLAPTNYTLILEFSQ